MDGKKSIFESAGIKFKQYIGMYTEGEIKSGDEILKALPRYLKVAGRMLGCAILGYLFGITSLAYSSIPLGTAYMCSLKKYVSFAYIGLLISAVVEKNGMALPLFLIYTALYIMRIIIYRNEGYVKKTFSLFGEQLLYRLVEGFGASLLISVYRAASFGFLYYDIFGGIFEIITVPLLIWAYNFAFDEKYKFSVKSECGWVAILSMTVLAMESVNIFGFSLGTITAILITLYISKTSDMLRGGVYGLVCGFVANAVMSPVYALMGIVAGVLWKAGNAAAVSFSCLAGVVCGIYVGGWETLSTSAPDMICAAIIFLPFVHYGLLPKADIYSFSVCENEDSHGIILAKKRQFDTEKRFDALSSAFSDLSSVFYTLSNRVRRPGVIDTYKICDDVCDKYCPKCVFHRVCWEKEFTSTQDVFSKIAKNLNNKGYADRNVVSSYMLERCRNMDKMLDSINTSHAELLENLIKQNKTEIFAMDYESMAHLLSSAVKVNGEEYMPDGKMCEKLREAANHMKIYAKSICVYGKRKMSVIASGINLSSVKMSAREIQTCFENVCEVKLTTPKFDVDGDYVTMTLESSRKFNTEYAAASNTKKNEKFCGDLICMFENERDYFYSLISDGMGSGREAALTSRLCGIFMKKMLMAGNTKPIALEMLNNFIRSKNTECFATIDLLEIDLLNGRASFVKSGAVASYVLRGDKIFKISSNTMPVGITREMNAEEVNFELQNNDVIVMVSDGVGQSEEDTVRVGNILTYSWEDDLQKMADKILKSASDNCSRSDDISVGIIRIKEV